MVNSVYKMAPNIKLFFFFWLVHWLFDLFGKYRTIRKHHLSTSGRNVVLEIRTPICCKTYFLKMAPNIKFVFFVLKYIGCLTHLKSIGHHEDLRTSIGYF